jgi:casein kinase II subunit alpha
MGDSNRDQLVKITQVLGTDKLYQYLKKYHIKIDE